MEQDDTDPTGVRETSKSVQQATTRARDRKAAAATYLYIEKHKELKVVAKKCGYPDAAAARVAIERHLETELREHPRSLAAMRDMAGRRLEHLLRGISKKALDPEDPEHLAAAREYRATVHEWVDTYGVRAPQQVVVNNPTAEAIMDIAMRILTEGAPDLENADIFTDDEDDSEILALEARVAALEGVDPTDIVDAELLGDLEREDSHA